MSPPDTPLKPKRRTGSPRRQFGQAGQLLTSREQRENAERAARHRQQEAESERTAREAWQRGEVVPHRITVALDINNLEGPGVDTACGAKEPDVDQWEAGEKYPTWEQLTALADLTGFPVQFFLMPESGGIHALGPGVMFVCKRSARNWNPVVEIPAPVLAFTPEAIAATVGGYCVACLDPQPGRSAVHTREQTALS